MFCNTNCSITFIFFAAGSLDLILNTVSASHEMMTYVPLLAIDGALVQLGKAADPVLE